MLCKLQWWETVEIPSMVDPAPLWQALSPAVPIWSSQPSLVAPPVPLKLAWAHLTAMKIRDCRQAVAGGFSRQHRVSRLAVAPGRPPAPHHAATGATRCPPDAA